MKYKGELKGFPDYVVEAMLDEQERQGNKRDVRVFEISLNTAAFYGGFDWFRSELCNQKEWYYILYNKKFDILKKKLATKREQKTSSPQPHYNNDNGSLYLLAEKLELNHWEFDILKRLVRCRKKGQFKEDILKIKDTCDIYLKEFE